MSHDRIEQLVAQCQATDMGLARAANGVRESIADLDRLLNKSAAPYIERFPPPAKHSKLGEHIANWLCAIALGLIVGYLAGKGF